MAFQRKLNTLILHKALKEKCKVIGCKKPKRVSGNCKKHEALNFLDYLRKTFKKLFGSLSSGLEALEKECGKEFNVKDLCGFLNFLMICYSHERVVSLFESFGKRSHKNLNFVMDFKIFKQNLEKTKNVDNNQKFASYQESLETLINNTDTRKPDESDLFHEKRLITSYDVSKKSFQSEFYLNRISSKDESIVSDRMDPTIYTKDYENELFGAINHENPEITKGLDLDLFKFTEAPLEKSQNQFISFFKDKLALKYSNFTEAFNSISRNLVSIGYFEILRELKELGILSDDKHVKEVILNIGDYKRGVISAQNFKEF